MGTTFWRCLQIQPTVQITRLTDRISSKPSELHRIKPNRQYAANRHRLTKATNWSSTSWTAKRLRWPRWPELPSWATWWTMWTTEWPSTSEYLNKWEPNNRIWTHCDLIPIDWDRARNDQDDQRHSAVPFLDRRLIDFAVVLSQRLLSELENRSFLVRKLDGFYVHPSDL